ncbi:MAG: radical SAM protein [Elusimicrobiota bacterium]
MDNSKKQIFFYEFSLAEIKEAEQNNRLLSMEIELSFRCNFRCSYCYVPDKLTAEKELTEGEIRDIIRQARDLGAKKIVLLGGEPMIYPLLFPMLEFIRDLGLTAEMFTNGINIDVPAAKRLLNLGVHVVLKINSFDEKKQDELTGCKGSYKIIHGALAALKDAGYPGQNAFLAASTIICRQNYEEIPGLWQWLRDQNIVPYFETITPQGRAKTTSDLHVDAQKVYELFSNLAEIDNTKYGYQWDPQPPLAGSRCMRHRFSCLVTAIGEVRPCVGITVSLGNVRQQKLKDILGDSKIVKDFKNYRQVIKGPCRNCDKADTCYGCRGAAYQLTGDYFASDPTCWRNSDKQKEIICLPLAVDPLIPQQSPMRVIDTLVKVGERKGEVSAQIKDGMLFVDEEGFIDEAIYMEMMAQAIASLEGFKHLGISASPPSGYLLGAKGIKIYGRAKTGDRLTIFVNEEAQFSNFYIIHGRIYRGTQLLVEGEIKVYKMADEEVPVS